MHVRRTAPAGEPPAGTIPSNAGCWRYHSAVIVAEPVFPPMPGAVLAGKYTVVRTIGRGGMAIVLEAHHERLGRNVALKLLHPDHMSNPEATSRFEREARAVARLASPNVARVIDVDALEDGCPFMVLELLEGCDLGQELSRRGPLPVQEAVDYVAQACAGIAIAHAAGIVHRDLKPSNLFLAQDGADRRVKILDFGISKLVAADPNARMTTTQSSFGTPLYMSPEQVKSVKDVDARTDIWSLGVILYELLTGRVPFEAESASAIFVAIAVETPRPVDEYRPDLPRGLSAVVMKALAKNPADRFVDAEAFAAALQPFAGAADARSEGAGRVRSNVAAVGATTTFEAPRRGRVVGLVVALCALAAIGAGVLKLRGERGPDTPAPPSQTTIVAEVPVAPPPTASAITDPPSADSPAAASPAPGGTAPKATPSSIVVAPAGPAPPRPPSSAPPSEKPAAKPPSEKPPKPAEKPPADAEGDFPKYL
jgi:serine/threonine-protein kinase